MLQGPRPTCSSNACSNDSSFSQPEAQLLTNHWQLEKRFLETSDPFYPSPWMDPDADGWREAYAQAREFVSQLTLPEKVNLTTGVGWVLPDDLFASLSRLC